MIKSFIKKYFKNFAFFYRRMGYRMFVMIALTFIVGLMDGLGLSMFLPLFEVAAGKEDVNGNGDNSKNYIENLFDSLEIPIALEYILALMAIFYIIKGAFQYFKVKYDTDSGRYFMLKTRKKLVRTFSNITYNYFSTSDVGRIQNIMTGELSTLYNAFTQYINMIQQLIMIVVYMTFAVAINAQFAILITAGGLIFNFLFKRIYKVTKEASRVRVGAANRYQGLIIQFVNSFKYLKATGSLNSYSSKINTTIEDIERENRKMGYMNAFASAIREPMLIIIVCTVILLQVYALGSTLSSILVSLLFFYRALTSVTFLQMSYNTFNMMIGTLENVNWFEKELNLNQEVEDGKLEFDQLREQIDLQNIKFDYGSTTVINNLSLTIGAKQTLAFVGESGSGKTTLVNIIAGLLPINQGQMIIDGKPKKDYNLFSYQKKIGYISQDPIIFSDTIFNNITFWDAPTPQNKIKYQSALRKAEIWDYVENLDEKGETLLGNNGINLSGGQKQRLSIARELYKKVELLIFDEATSALDSQTEKSIQENIDALKGDVTILIIAHRLSTIKNADEIIFMSKGNILNKGSFNHLKTIEPRFKKMVELQEM